LNSAEVCVALRAQRRHQRLGRRHRFHTGQHVDHRLGRQPGHGRAADVLNMSMKSAGKQRQEPIPLSLEQRRPARVMKPPASLAAESEWWSVM
jgi:hypothetical protein